MSDRVPAGDNARHHFDRLIHEPARLLVVGHLYVVEEADFLFVMHNTGLTQGNLSSHVTKLERAGYVEVMKTFADKRPRTVLRLTTQGREAFASYVEDMQHFLQGLGDPTTAWVREA